MKFTTKILLWLFFYCLCALITIKLVMVWIGYEMYTFESLRNSEDVELTVEPGSTASSIINRIYHPKMNRYIIKYWLKHNGNLTAVKKGYYHIPKNTCPKDALEMIVNGREMTFSITLVEGNTVDAVLQSVKSNKNLTHVLKKDFGEQDLKKLLGVSYSSPEGLLMPETYSFVKGETDVNLLKRAYSDMDSFLKKEYAGRKPDLPYKNEYEALIMASIVEKETSVPEERAKIASVFVNRLKKGMKLQTDPTVIYGVRSRYKGKIYQSYLRDDNEYNTYIISGLPPTPIALPGKASIEAALHPDDTEYLFFVAKGPDPKQGHIFSVNEKMHNIAVQNYREAVKEYKKQHASESKDE
ncbi:endolytic transglycosylase MltG [Ruminobacter sp. RM87]|uniref:endolytic transglycosylase MltG n=1 Tax=Ruminobacter TaxID=866 RepID=UPI00068B4F8B|nr:endolytic transglycosylase MltG [Ruminobacter sp. RM87]